MIALDLEVIAHDESIWETHNSKGRPLSADRPAHAQKLGAPTVITIAVGGKTGVYYAVSSAICCLVNRVRQSKNVVCRYITGGSVANIKALRKGSIDDDFRRPKETMVKVEKPPFLIGEIWPVVSNTQCGPRHDTKQGIVNPYGEPIPRLFEAGELGSVWGYLYLDGGNLSECFITGRIAGNEAAKLKAWD